MNRWTAAGLLGTLLLVPGCGTMGLMTRSSYSTIRDPFLEGSEDPTAGDGGAVVSGDLAGRVAVDADPAGPAPLPGASACRPGVVVQAGRDRGLLLLAAPGHHPG